ncbi:NACHT domain-containing protein [Zarconia navalis]|nr:hypothetical protein [Zarconia navalis]
MLELARELLDAAWADGSQPIPVLVSLSSWKQPKVEIFDWLVAELKAKYGLRQDLGKEWLESGALLPLLDGLDEVTPELQQHCAEAINTWLTGDLEKQPCGVLVCCRREEFEKIVRKKLSLQGAIYLQPLTATQIEAYFTRLKLPEVWQTVREDAPLRELLTKPLFLSMFGLVQIQGKFDLAAWKKRETSEAKIEYLFDTYWDAVMSRELILDPDKKKLGWLSKTYTNKALPKPEAVKRTLVFVANAIEHDPRLGSEFMIEKMQPLWLKSKTKESYYYIVLSFIASFVLFFTIELYFYFLYKLFLINILYISLIFFFIISLFMILVHNLTPVKNKIYFIEDIKLPETSEERKYSTSILRKELIRDLICSLIISLVCSFYLAPILDSKTIFMASFVFCFTGGLIKGIVKGFKTDVENKIIPNQGFKNSMKNTIYWGLVILCITSMIKIEFIDSLKVQQFSSAMSSNSILSLCIILILWLSIVFLGVYPSTQHIALRIVLAWNRYVPLRFDRLLDYCTERLLIQRIGGRYRFVHKLLQDHFAKMELD